MLKHGDIPQNQPPPAAQVRVTPEELAAAVTALQIRKEGQPGTIAIGDAVEELGLDVMPEEVLAEVQAKRQVVKPKKRRDYRALACAAACIAAFPLVAAARFAQVTYSPPSASSNAIAIPPADHLLLDADHLQVGGVATRKLFLMSEVADNYPVYAILSGNQEWGDYAPNYGSTSWWILVKHGGAVYVRGWMVPASEKLIRQNRVEIENSRRAKNNVQITLPLMGFKVVPDVNALGATKFHAEDVHLDKYAYERW